MDEQIVLRPQTQTVAQINAEANQDIRAIRIARMGWPRYIRDSGLAAIDERRNDVEGTREALFRCQDGSARLVVTCPTKRVFALGVPDSITTCENAQRWLRDDNTFNVIART